MFKWLKAKLYFIVANYFLFFAGIQLRLWKPKIIVITGSSGKTTLLHFTESLLGAEAKYSHNANSAFGISFDILGLKRPKLVLGEWPYLFLAAPFKAFKKPFKEKLYVVEADCDRPKEGKFMASFLKPNATLWTNSSRTHTMNFDKSVLEKKFPNVEEAIAYEFGSFLEDTSGLAIINGDIKIMAGQIARAKAAVKLIKKEQLKIYKVNKDSTEFQIGSDRFQIPAILPEESFYSIAMAMELIKYLGFPAKALFSNFVLPPGRGSVFKGAKGINIIDSSYNATPDGVAAILKMFKEYPSQNKWLVLGDMLELGREEQEEHEKLAEFLSGMDLHKIILIGPRISKYAYPKIKDKNNVQAFEMPKDALDYILGNISGQETILFKGARFLEGIIEHLLDDKNDIRKLCRRELIWQIRRKQWGL